MALELLFVIIIWQIFALVQYVHKNFMHFLTSSTMKELASWDFLKSFKNKGYKYGSIFFFKASHISVRAIIAFLETLDLKDSTNFNTSGIMAGKF